MGIAGSAIDLIRTVFARDLTLPYPATLGPDSQAIAGYQNSAIGPQSEYNNFMAGNVTIEQNLMARYADYEEMNSYAEIGAAFDLLADDATIQDVLTGRSIWFESPDKNIEKILNDMLNYNLRMEEDIRDIARGLVQYGNEFEEIIVMDGLGVVKLNNLNTPAVRRIEDKNGTLYGFVHDEQMAFSISTPDFMNKLRAKSSVDAMQALGVSDGLSVYEPWEVVHFRLKGASRKDLYGSSAAESARYVWKRLTMMEDAMVLYKLTRSPQRLVFYVDVGDAPPNQARAMLQKIKMDFKKQKYVNDQGKLDLRYSPLSADEDLFIGTRKGKRSSEVEVLSGPEGQQIEDVNYFRDKLFTALKIPKSYLGMDETVGHHNLAQLDVRHARSVMRIQRELKNGVSQVGRVDLAARNIDPDKVDHVCKMVIPSGAMEAAQMEVMAAKMDLGGKYRDAQFSEYFIWSEILGLSDETIQKIRRDRAIELGDDEVKESVSRRVVDSLTSEKKFFGINGAAKDVTNKIRDEIAEGRTDFAKRMRELKGLMQEVQHSIKGIGRKRRD